jgi:hypothetical protein
MRQHHSMFGRRAARDQTDICSFRVAGSTQTPWVRPAVRDETTSANELSTDDAELGTSSSVLAAERHATVPHVSAKGRVVRKHWAGRGVVSARRHLRRAGVPGVALTVLFARSALGGVPDATPGAPLCRELPRPTTIQYETGVACPPRAFAVSFGYRPVLVSTPAGWRYTRPSSAGGGCSGPMSDRGPFWSFGDACRAHDYGYDLVRFGIGDRGAADLLLYRDMRRTCTTSDPVADWACRTLADSAHAVLWVGDATPGFEPRGSQA